MSGQGRDDRDRARRLMMAALDGEGTEDERAELDRWLARDPELQHEWEKLSRVKEVTGAMTLKRPPEEVWGTYWVSVYNRLERGLAWILVSVGAIILLAFGLWEGLGALLADTELPGFVKVAIFAALFGFSVLLFSVIREKIFMRRRDPYKEIER